MRPMDALGFFFFFFFDKSMVAVGLIIIDSVKFSKSKLALIFFKTGKKQEIL